MDPFNSQQLAEAQTLIDLALAEDLGDVGDLTSLSVISPAATGRVNVVARESGIVAGLPILKMVFSAIDKNVDCKISEDGGHVDRGTVVGEIHGSVRALLSGERTALNFLSHLSGIATSTSQYVERVAGTKAKILDTRKTLPGWRTLQKYAVLCGGGVNHRMGLFDAIMIKDNHVAAWTEANRNLVDAAKSARAYVVDNRHAVQFIQVEVDTIAQLKDVLPSKPDLVLLDNMPPQTLSEAVAIRDQTAPKIQLEASGGITLDSVRAVAETGVDRISIGALTHTVRALDFGFDWSYD